MNEDERGSIRCLIRTPILLHVVIYTIYNIEGNLINLFKWVIYNRLTDKEVFMDTQQAILDQIKKLYLSCRNRYVLCNRRGRFFVPKRNGEYCLLTDNILRNHLHRQYAVGIYASDQGSKFICFDVDDGNVSTVTRVIAE